MSDTWRKSSWKCRGSLCKRKSNEEQQQK